MAKKSGATCIEAQCQDFLKVTLTLMGGGDVFTFCGFVFVVHNFFILSFILLSCLSCCSPFIQLSNGRFTLDIAYSHIQFQVNTVTSLSLFITHHK